MLLPPKIGSEPIKLPSNIRQVTIIGANGCGKTRFAHYLAQQLKPKAFILSAIGALCEPNDRENQDGTIDAIYREAAASPTFLHADERTTFERLMILLLNEEMANLVSYKVALASGENAVMPESKLDSVILHWNEVFPDNHVMREGGTLLFSRKGDSKTYSQRRLSHGEKAVLYYFGAVLFAPTQGYVFVDSPGTFLHNSIMRRLWDTIESMRPDCRFIYITHDVDFAASRSENAIVWVRSFNPDTESWDYDLLPANSDLSEEIYLALVGSRRPVMFIEGDATHSIDAKLYPLIFRDYTVKSLGSCNKVIEATRAFNDLRAFHHLESCGIVDRDRRDAQEVAYLRGKNVFVPEVAEIENILMLEDVIKAVAKFNGHDPNKAFAKVRDSVLSQFKHDIRQQALLHTRHRVKRTVEYRVDGRFTNINALEEHMQNLVHEINPRGLYESFCREFSRIAALGDYAEVLRVYNQKAMVPRSNVSQLCGLSGSKDAYVQCIISILKTDTPEAARIRTAISRCFAL